MRLLAAVLAAVGLGTNSAPTIVASMLVAPLMCAPARCSPTSASTGQCRPCVPCTAEHLIAVHCSDCCRLSALAPAATPGHTMTGATGIVYLDWLAESTEAEGNFCIFRNGPHVLRARHLLHRCRVSVDSTDTALLSGHVQALTCVSVSWCRGKASAAWST